MKLNKYEGEDGTIDYFLPEGSSQPRRLVASVKENSGMWEVQPGENIAWAGLRGRYTTKATALDHVEEVARTGERP